MDLTHYFVVWLSEQGSLSNDRIKIQDFFSMINTRKTHRCTLAKLQAPELFK